MKKKNTRRKEIKMDKKYYKGEEVEVIKKIDDNFSLIKIGKYMQEQGDNYLEPPYSYEYNDYREVRDEELSNTIINVFEKYEQDEKKLKEKYNEMKIGLEKEHKKQKEEYDNIIKKFKDKCDKYKELNF
jgi:hypothetical protein